MILQMFSATNPAAAPTRAVIGTTIGAATGHTAEATAPAAGTALLTKFNIVFITPGFSTSCCAWCVSSILARKSSAVLVLLSIRPGVRNLPFSTFGTFAIVSLPVLPHNILS